MFVHQIKEFITRLRVISTLDCDIGFLARFEERFSSALDESLLSSSDFQFIQEIFSERITSVLDTSDYTLRKSAVNNLWIGFSHDLAKELDCSFLQILFPNVKNCVDPNNLQKLASHNELTDFYLGDDGKTLFLTDGLLTILRQKKELSTYSFLEHKKFKLISVSLLELSRLKKKSYYSMSNDKPSLWSDLTQNVIPKWRNNGELPQQVLRPLLSLVESYFAEVRHSDVLTQFPINILNWAKFERELPVEDVYCLYGQELQVNGEPTHLVEVLIDCLRAKGAKLNARMRAIARWLCTYDPSLVSEQRELFPVYQARKIGPYFNSEILVKFLKSLRPGSSLKIQTKLGRLLAQLEHSSKMDSELIDGIADVYRERWLEIKNGDEVYTQMQSCANGNWIRLAQILAGAKLIKPNYYRFLMPTIEHDEDPVQLNFLTDFPLSHYIVSDDSRRLILLDNCVEQYKANGVFCNCETNQPFTPTERSRIQKAHPKFQKWFSHVVYSNDYTEPAIQRSTLLQVKAFVENSLYPQGLELMHEYTEMQQASANKAYVTFCKFLRSLSHDERQKLYAQRICYRGKNVCRNISFSELLAELEQGACIAMCCKYLTQMIMDYGHYLQLTPAIEAKVDVARMRANSRMKVYSCYNHIDHNEARRRLKILMVSLMSNKFAYSLGKGIRCDLWGSSNILNGVAKRIYDIIKPIVESGDYKQSRYVFARIIEEVVGPALANNKVSDDSTRDWLLSISNASMFKLGSSHATIWYSPKLILKTLLPMKESNPNQKMVENFLDEFIRIYANSENAALKEISVNIKFSKFIQSVPKRVGEDVLCSLEEAKQKRTSANFCDLYAEYLIHRLASLVSNLVRQRPITFFEDVIAGDSNNIYRYTKRELSQAVGSDVCSLQDVHDRLDNKITDMQNRVIKSREATEKMKRCLDEMMPAFDPQRGARGIRAC